MSKANIEKIPEVRELRIYKYIDFETVKLIKSKKKLSDLKLSSKKISQNLIFLW